MHRINLGALRKSVAGAVSSAAHGARDLASEAKEAIERAMVAKCLRPYLVRQQIATTGPRGLWKIYSADYRNPGTYARTNDFRATAAALGGHYPSVSVWILEKKLLQESTKGKSRAWDPFLDQQRTGAALLTRLMHPGIVKIIEPLEETRAQFVMVTEPVFCSLSDWLNYFSLIPNVTEAVREASFTELEIKHGLLQVASAIGFLHNDVNRAHCSISPEGVLICADGHWALANLGLSTEIDFTGSKLVPGFDYSQLHPPFEEAVTKPRLEFVAPELTVSPGENPSVEIRTAVDVFSLGLLIYSCLTRVELLKGVDEDIGRYRTKMASIGQLDLSTLPSSLQPFERMMLSASPSNRPPISAVMACSYFQDDKLLRALQFLEGMVGKDPMQKASFLKDLDQFWTQFDVRILRHKVLPPLLQELQNPALQSLVIPFIFKSAASQDRAEFESHTLPKLKAVMKNVKGDALLTVINHCEPLMKVMTREAVGQVLIPVFLRAFDQTSAKIQEEALKKSQAVFECLEYQELKSKLLPRIHVMSMKTVSAKVRINSLVLMGHLVPRLDRDEATKMIHTCTQITQVDKSPGTLMCVLGVGDSISKYWGEEMTAEVVLPFLSPLLIGKTLSHQQFSTYMTVVKDMIQRIEDKIGKQIQETEPVKLETSPGPQNTEPISWDTEKPKDDGLSGLAPWTDLSLPGMTPSPVTSSQPLSPVPMLGAQSTVSWPTTSDNFLDFGAVNGMAAPRSEPMLDTLGFTATNSPSANGGVSNAPPDLFSDLTVGGAPSGGVRNQQVDFFSDFGMSAAPAPTAAPDPFLGVKKDDPFADLLG